MIKKTFLHFKKICTHKRWVAHYCFKMGLYKQGIMHDMSKFSPIEFWSGVKYYQGGSSPIDAEKAAVGYSLAWQHHKGRNPHHYEYWLDNFDKGGTPLIMPKKYAMELIADYLGAGRAYMGKNFTYNKEYEWWLKKCQNPLAMHPMIKMFINDTLNYLAIGESHNADLNFSFKQIGSIYDHAEWRYKNKC